MAGHASNWFKIGTGALKGTAVYINKAQQLDFAASTKKSLSGARTAIQNYVNITAIHDTLLQSDFVNQNLPKGMAQKKLPSGAESSPVEGLSSTSNPGTVAAGTPNRGALGVGDSIAVPAAGAAKGENIVTPAGGIIREIKGDFALVQSGDVYHVVNTKSGVPVSLHHGSEATARAALLSAKPGNPNIFVLPSPVVSQQMLKFGAGKPVMVEEYGPLGVFQENRSWTVYHLGTGAPMQTFLDTKERALASVTAALTSDVKWDALRSYQDVEDVTYTSEVPTLMPNMLLQTPLLQPTAKHGMNDVFDQASPFDAWESGQKSTTTDPFGMNTEAIQKLTAPWVGANPVPPSPSQTKALADYQGANYASLYNAVMSQTPDVTKSQYRETIRELDSLMGSTTMPVNMVATRSKGRDSEDYRWAAQLQVGGEFRPPTYQGASVSSPTNNWKDLGLQGVRFHYRMPKGSKGTGSHVSAYTKDMADEAEFLVHRNTRWKVSGKTVSPNGFIEVVLDYQGPGNDKPGEWTTGGRPVRNP